MDSLNLCWRGQPQSGKKTALRAALKSIADMRGIPFSIQTRQFSMGSAARNDNSQISTTAEEENDHDSKSDKDTFPFEFSYVHIGFDIARMSMQDKIYLKPILQRWSTGSQVLAGDQGRGSRILVFYHAHLFSTESYFLLHSLMEKSFGDVSLWFTSELPIADRLSDYFIEIPVSQRSIVTTNPSWHSIFRKVLLNWSQKSYPKLMETAEIRSFLYELLMRNLRWTDCVHYLLDVTMDIEMDWSKKQKIFQILAKQEATAAGETIPSYRIPLLWEALFLEIREAVSNNSLEDGTSTDSEHTHRRSKQSVPATTPQVAPRSSKSKRSTVHPVGDST